LRHRNAEHVLEHVPGARNRVLDYPKQCGAILDSSENSKDWLLLNFAIEVKVKKGKMISTTYSEITTSDERAEIFFIWSAEQCWYWLVLSIFVLASGQQPVYSVGCTLYRGLLPPSPSFSHGPW